MRKLLFPAVLSLTLSACMPVATVEPVPAAPSPAPTAEDFPGVDVDAIALCVRENATEGELALMALGGERAQTATAQVLNRPETLACLQRVQATLPGMPAS